MHQILAEYEQYLQKFYFVKHKDNSKDEYITASENGGQYFSEAITLFKYSSKQPDLGRITLIVPSLFNSPNILFINKTKNFVEYLQDISSVYLVEWQEIASPEYNLDNYVFEITELLKYLNKNYKCKIDLIGHCIGGTLSIIAANINPDSISSVTLLNTPWDFSYLKPQRDICRQFKFDEAILHLNQVPPIYQQISFFLLNPEYFQKKIAKFFKILNKNQNELEVFLKTEYWLLSSKSLPQALYVQLTEQIIDQNMLYQNKWFIGDRLVSELKIDLPVCIISAKKDNIVPPESTIALIEIIKSSKMIKVDGGHISYLISSKINDFFSEYRSWLLTCN